MKVKVKHNKKRNTAFLYEALVRQMTKCVLEQQEKEHSDLLVIFKDFFSKGKRLSEELKLYKTVLSCERVKPDLVGDIISESRRRYDALDQHAIFKEQGKLISIINKKYGREFYSSPVADYRNLATLDAIFNSSTPIKTKVLLERNLVESLSCVRQEKEPHELVGTTLLTNSFLRKFNEKYSHLHEEQKCLLNAFIMSLADDGLSLKAFLNEELGRLKKIITESAELEEVRADPQMLENTAKVLQIFKECKSKPITGDFLERVLKLQVLAREVQS